MDFNSFPQSTFVDSYSTALFDSSKFDPSNRFNADPLSQPFKASTALPISDDQIVATIVDRANGDRPLNNRAKRRKVNGTPNDDSRLVARGDTVLKGLAGNDNLIAQKTNNVLLGGSGDDTLNARRGRGGNVLKGGSGADELIGGGRDDLLVGGGGADVLVIADGKFNPGVSIIKGFKDDDAIALLNVGKADEFGDLGFKKQGKDTLIRVGKRDIALVQRTKPAALQAKADNFVFGNEVEIPPEVPPEVPPEPPPETPPEPPPVITDPVIPSVPVRLTISNQTISEGNTDTTIVFTVTLDTAVSTPVTVSYSTVDGTAIAGSDYTAVSGTLTFAANTTSQTFTVPILGDGIEENDETFGVNLANPVGAELAISQATATILNDDAGPEFRDQRQGKMLERPSAAPDLVFNIFDTLNTGQVITDNAPDDENVGVFVGAIENFNFTARGFAGVESTLNLPVGTLQATRTDDLITYLFSSDAAQVLVNNPGKGIVIPNEVLSIEAVRLTVDLTSATIPPDFDPVQAVNNLEYIIAQVTFQYADAATAFAGESVTDIDFQPDICLPGDSNCIDLTEAAT